jgi:transposase
VQIVIALVVTPEGLPLAYEVLPGNTADNTTLRGSSNASSGNTARRAGSG